jgi:DNA-binding transcriptional MocR family regulator
MDTTPPIQILQTVIDPEVIDLGVGNPPTDLLPLELIRRAAEQQLNRPERDFLQYGAELGDGYLRQALAHYLERQQGVPASPPELLITSGASAALDLICTLFTQPGDLVFVEEPSYFLALRIFADHRLRLVGIPVDEGGLNLEALQAALARQRPALLYTIPAFQNPGGVTLAHERRQRLAELSREFDFLVVADEVYQFLYYGEPPPLPMSNYAGQGNILSLGSFSKILAPGLRLGWIQTHPDLARRIASCGLLDSGGGMNPFASAIVRWVVESGELQAHLAGLRLAYAARAAALHAALSEHLPQLTYHRAQGGFFFWTRLPSGIDAGDFLPHAARFKVGFRPGVSFSSTGGLRDYMRLCFAYYSQAQLALGVERLAEALAAYRAGSRSGA